MKKNWYLNGRGPSIGYGIYAYDDEGFPRSPSPVIAPSGSIVHIVWPSCIKVGDVTNIWASIDEGTGFNKIRRWISPDGLNFSDQGDVLVANGSEPNGIGPAQVIYDPTQADPYIMFYNIRGASSAPGTTIGCATSQDGISWTRQGVVLTASGTDEAGGIATGYALKLGNEDYAIVYSAYPSGLATASTKIATCSTPTGTFGSKAVLMQPDNFSSTLTATAGEMIGTVPSGVVVPLGVPLIMTSSQEVIVAKRQINSTTVIFDRPFSSSHSAATFYSAARRKVEGSFIEQQDDGTWKGIFTLYAPDTGIAAEYTANVEGPSFGSPWTFTGEGLRFKPWINGSLTSLENPTPLLEYAAPAASGGSGGIASCGRITLTSGVPVTTADVLAATTIYFTPEEGDQITLFNGVDLETISFTEKSIAVPATTNMMYDVFGYSNAGVLTLELLAWTSLTVRAIALGRQNGFEVKSSDLTRRWLGTISTTGVSGQVEDSLKKRYVFNNLNRRKRPFKVEEGTASWPYSIAAWRQANNNAANQVDIVLGVCEDSVSLSLVTSASNNTGTSRILYSNIGLDNLTPTPIMGFAGGQGVVNALLNFTNVGEKYIAEGRHYLAWLEFGAGVDTQTWYGGNARGLQGYFIG